MPSVRATQPVLIFWIIAGWVGYALLPWYMVEDGLWSFEWLFDGYPFDEDCAPAAFLIAQGEKLWLTPLLKPLALPFMALGRAKSDPAYARILILAGALGFGWLIAQGFGIGIRGFNFEWLEALLGELGDSQFGMGYGAMICAAAFLFLLTQGIAARGVINGDVFVGVAIGGVITIVTAFVFYPIANMLFSAFVTEDGAYSLSVFAEKFFDDRLWGLGCFWGARCGAAWNSLFLALSVGFITTVLGLCFALVVTRSSFRYKRAIRALTVLPIITPPFVIGLALILRFGRSGSITASFADLFGVQPTRWLYGMPGVLIAQTLAFTPIAFLVLIGVVEGVSPSMEETSQTLRANRWQTFRTVSLPLMRPGLANAFQLGFIESMADFGNPLVLGGNFDVLSTEIFFAIVGAQYDQGRAAILAMVLLFFTLSAFYAQRAWLGKKYYTTVSGMGDAGVHPLMPVGLSMSVMCIALTWALFTALVYVMIVYGSVVELWGVNNTLAFKHYVTAFSVRFEAEGIRRTGAGIASMSQLDKSLDESSLTLGANSWQTLRKVILPLLRPAILAALVYSFVRAMTAISAVIFLVSARYDMATSYIIGRVKNNDYGLAIAYSTTLIFVMLAVVGLMQLAVGRTRIGRRMTQSRTNV